MPGWLLAAMSQRCRIVLALCDLGQAPLVELERLDERLDHRGVELRPGETTQLSERGFIGHPFAVGAVRCHRAERVADEDDPGSQRNRLALQPVRIAAAIEVLVSGAHDDADLQERRRRGDDLLADQRVAADELPFLLVKR